MRLAEAKLEFATTAEPLDVVDAVNLTTEGIAFLNRIEHPDPARTNARLFR